MDQLCHEILLKIFTYNIGFRCLLIARLTCKNFNYVIMDKTIWNVYINYITSKGSYIDPPDINNTLARIKYIIGTLALYSFDMKFGTLDTITYRFPYTYALQKLSEDGKIYIKADGMESLSLIPPEWKSVADLAKNKIKYVIIEF